MPGLLPDTKPKKSKVILPPNGSAVAKEIEQLSRTPFRYELARILNCAPTDKALKAFASKSPDRWTQALSILAKLSGYSDKTILEHNINVLIGNMSDAELLARIAKAEQNQKAIDCQYSVPNDAPIQSSSDSLKASATSALTDNRPAPK